MRIRTCFGVFLILSAVGCAKDPHDLRLTESTKEQVMQDAVKSERLTADEKALLGRYLLRTGMGAAFGQKAASVEGRTVGDLIQEERNVETQAKAEEEKQSRLAAEAKKQELERLRMLKTALVIAPYSLGERETGFLKATELKYVVENTSSRDIRAFEGMLVFRDVLGNKVENVYIKSTDPLKAGQKRNDHWVNMMSSLSGKKLDDLKAEWVPDTVLFVDGQRIDREDKSPSS